MTGLAKAAEHAALACALVSASRENGGLRGFERLAARQLRIAGEALATLTEESADARLNAPSPDLTAARGRP